MKKFAKLSIICILIFSLTIGMTACGSSKTASNESGVKERTWKIGHVRPEGTSTDLDVKAFAEEVNKNSGGKIKIDVYAASQLGDYTVVQERVGVGDVEMQLAPAGTSINKAMGIASAPYICKTWDDVKRVFARDGKLMTNIDKMFADQNIKLLAAYPKYFGGIALAKEPKDPKNVNVSKDVKIRVPSMKAYEKTAEALGYIATPIAYSEAFTAMQTGIVDGIIGSGAEGYYSSFRDLTKYYLPVNDHFEMWFLYLSMDVWNDLSDEEKKIVMDAALKMEENRYAQAEAEEKEFIEKLKEHGVTIIEFSKEEIDAIANKVKEEVWPKIKDEYGAEFFDSVTKE
ncbi:C4-dicarboxylate ABC transporter [Crassaminicella thermophila]|uniref:C4-dicarboxylate ABC transporter n=1 Tax=Crassaminicella thermophila TaxID=2599308 RepID=A0A5C0SC40_CRATE|nr:TRAP transporter substrate-binding protein DctP [Crassaminicella thermophila]QEK11492.1 C4-dicarboxylate ABC transporter [Crassaminicella thermophila]